MAPIVDHHSINDVGEIAFRLRGPGRVHDQAALAGVRDRLEPQGRLPDPGRAFDDEGCLAFRRSIEEGLDGDPLRLPADDPWHRAMIRGRARHVQTEEASGR